MRRAVGPNNQSRRRNRAPRRRNNRSAFTPITNSGSQASNSMRRMISCTIPKGLQMFPDSYTCWAKTKVDNGFSGSAQYSNSYHINSPGFTFGPQANYTGSFANNYPSGLAILWGSSIATGSNSPYLFACAYEFEAYWDAVNTTGVPVYLSMVPTNAVSLSGMPNATLSEQRGAVQILVPPSQTTSPVRLKCVFSLSDVFGIPQHEIIANPFYRQQIGGLPSFSAYLHLIAAAADGTTTVVVNSSLVVYMKIRFSTLNPLTSNAPS